MKCLDCGYNISADEIDEHEGHEIIKGFFEDKMTNTVKDWKQREKLVYQMQVKDKACTICANVRKGGKICRECGDTRINWEKEARQPS